jgi:UDP:flavonoid glycosyltransferase YjiC (YdhE family)
VSAESLGEALRLALTCDAMRAKLGALSVALRREDGAGRAADVIERTVMRH